MFYKGIFFVAFLMLFSVSTKTVAQEDESLTFLHGPYLQNVTETGATIIFSTNKLSVPGVLIKSGDGKFELIQNSTDGLIDVGKNIHKVRIENLDPGQQYQYKLFAKEFIEYHPYKVVYGETINSEVYSFKTFDSNQKQINFTVFCDIHHQADKLGKYLDSNNIEKQDFYFLNGDILGHIEEEAQVYSGFLDTCISRFAAEKPFFYARGNHETRGKFARNLKNYLDLPDNSFYYAVSIGNTRFVILDSGEDKPDTQEVYAGLADFDKYSLKQLEWLKKEVVSKEFKKAQFNIVIVHMPIIKNKENRYGMEFLAEHFGPVLKKAKIDLMISGHMHKNKWINAKKSGFNYPVIICSNNDYIEAEVDKTGISIHLKNLDGDIIDEHKIEK
ncbi:MAG: metallophosphoesterase [Draconibacterium sp.]|nr:metallophosphoesterase [Draconibacterium sp.]